jgi:hypothetical protein
MGAVRIDRLDAAALAVLIAGFCFYWLTAARAESFGSDTSTYYGLAQSLLFNHRYWFDFEPHTLYPPGFPLLLAGLMALGVQSFASLVKACIVGYFLGLAGVYLLLRRQRGAAVALAVLALVVTSYVFHFWATVGVHSEAAYFTTGVLALLCADVAATTRRSGRRVWAYIGVALLASYLLMVRTIGITFVAGLFLWRLWPLLDRPSDLSPGAALQRLLRWSVVMMVPILTFAAWMAWSAANRPHDEPGDYMQSYVQQVLKEDPHEIDSGKVSLTTLPRRTLHMLAIRVENMTRTLLNLRRIPLGWKNPLCLLLFVVVAAGWLTSLKTHSTPAHWYVLAYFAMLLVYPFDEGSRYLHPVQPFLALYAIAGLEALTNAVRPWWPLARRQLRLATAAVSVSILVLGGQQIYAQSRINRFLNAATVTTADWITRNTPPDAVIMGDQYPILHRLTSRKTVRFPLSTDPRVLRSQITSAGVDFIIVLNERPYEYFSPSTMRRFATLRAEAPDSFVPVHVFESGTIYRVQGSAASRR